MKHSRRHRACTSFQAYVFTKLVLETKNEQDIHRKLTEMDFEELKKLEFNCKTKDLQLFLPRGSSHRALNVPKLRHDTRTDALLTSPSWIS